LLRQNNQKSKATWRNFAAKKNFKFTAGFWGTDAKIEGDYEGYQLTLEAVREAQTKEIRTRLTLRPYTPVLPVTPTTAQEERQLAAHLRTLTSATIPSKKKGQLKFGPELQTVSYEEVGFEIDTEYLASLLKPLGSLLEIYLQVDALNGQTILELHRLAAQEKNQLAAGLLQYIGQETTHRFQSRANRLLCPHCLTRFGKHQVHLSWFNPITYYGCRTCHQSRDIIEWPGQVIAVLDRSMSDEQTRQGQRLGVNWLNRRSLFDFDGVYINQASDEEVERFAVQVGNDTDALRREKYAHMVCLVSPQATFSENSLRILQRTFNEVMRQ
jgi:hypothetical protein